MGDEVPPDLGKSRKNFEEAVGMFALFDQEFDEAFADLVTPKTQQLMYVYVKQEYRGLGIAKQIIQQARQIARENQVERIQFDTLRPHLNKMYEKYGDAELLCEHHLFGHSTDVFRMK